MTPGGQTRAVQPLKHLQLREDGLIITIFKFTPNISLFGMEKNSQEVVLCSSFVVKSSRTFLTSGDHTYRSCWRSVNSQSKYFLML